MIEFRKLLRGGARDEVGDAIARLNRQAATLQAMIDAAAAARRANAAAALSGDGAAARKIEAAERAATHARGELERVNIVLEEARARQQRLAAEATSAERSQGLARLDALIAERRREVETVDAALATTAKGLRRMAQLGLQIRDLANTLSPSGQDKTHPLVRPLVDGPSASRLGRGAWVHGLGEFFTLHVPMINKGRPLPEAEEADVHQHYRCLAHGERGAPSKATAPADDEPDPPQAA